MLAVAVIAFFDLFSYSLVFPLLPFYAAQFCATSFQTGLLIGCFALAQMLSSPLLGRVSDAAGRKPVLLLTTGGTVVGFLLFANAWSLAGLFVARLVDGVTGANTTAAQAYISDLVPDKAGRAQGFAWLAVAGSLGFVCGPILGGASAPAEATVSTQPASLHLPYLTPLRPVRRACQRRMGYEGTAAARRRHRVS